MSDFQKFFYDSSALRDKLAVDVVSRLKSSAKTIEFSEYRSGLFDRVADGLSGRAKRRGDRVAADLNKALDGVVGLVEDLIESHNVSARAIVKISEEVKDLSSLSVDLAAGLQRIDRMVSGLGSRMNEVEKRLSDLTDWVSVKDEVEFLCDKIRVNQFHPKLSPSSRIYCLLEELKWGDFGLFYDSSYITVRRDLRARLEVKILSALKDSSGLDSTQRVGREYWFSEPGLISSDADRALISDSLAFLGSWASPDHQPIVCSTIEYPRLGGSGANDDTPWIISGARIATLLTHEVFGSREVL